MPKPKPGSQSKPRYSTVRSSSPASSKRIMLKVSFTLRSGEDSMPFRCWISATCGENASSHAKEGLVRVKVNPGEPGGCVEPTRLKRCDVAGPKHVGSVNA